MDGDVDTTVLAAFGVGLLSFFSPCVLPLVPGYLAAISGVAVDRAPKTPARGGCSSRRCIFVGAFTVIFMLGGMVATGIGQADDRQHRAAAQDQRRGDHRARRVSGGDALRAGAEHRDAQSEQLARRAGVGGPIIAGAAFAIAWTPCVGPTLGAILTAASTQQNLVQGAILLFFYSAGLAVPFIASAARASAR